MENETANSSLGILDLDKMDDFTSSLDSIKLQQSVQQIKQKAVENMSHNIRLSLANSPVLVDLTGTQYMKPKPEISTVAEKILRRSRSWMSDDDSDDSTTLHIPDGITSKYLCEGSPSFQLSIDSLGSADSFVQDSPKVAAQALPTSEDTFLLVDKALEEPFKVFRSTSIVCSDDVPIETKERNSTIQEFFHSGASALKLINEAEKENQQKNTLEITDGHVFNESQNLINDFSNFTIGENRTIDGASHPFGEPHWGKPGSKTNRPSFGFPVTSPIRETDSTLRDCTISSIASEVDSYRQFEKNLELSSYAVPKSSTAVQQNQERRRVARMNSSMNSSSAPPPRRSTRVDSCSTVVHDKSISVSELIEEAKKSQKPLCSTPNTRSQSPAISESSGSTIVNASECQKPCCGSNPQSSGASTNISGSPSTERYCPQPCCSRGLPSPSPSDQATLQLQVPVSCQWNIITPSPQAPIVTAPSRVNYVTPLQWSEPQYSNLQYRPGSPSFPQMMFHPSSICPSELPEMIVCLDERVEMLVPVSNPWPTTHLQCQLSIAEISCNGQTLPPNPEENLLACAWPRQAFTLLPSETRKFPVSFVARYPGSLSLHLEVRCTPAYPSGTLSSSTGFVISRCILKCQVEWPRVQLEPECLQIQASNSSGKASPQNSSLFLCNFTAVPVTVTLQITMVQTPRNDCLSTSSETPINVEEILRIPGNGIHCWLSLRSGYTLTVRLAAGCTATGLPSRAEIPLSFNRTQHYSSTSIPKGTYSQGGVMGTVVVTHKNMFQTLPLAESKILLVSCMNTEVSKVPQKDSNPKQSNPQAKEELPKLRSTRRLICFPATEVNGTRKQELLLKNVGPPIILTVSIQVPENSIFTLCSEDQVNHQEELEYQLSRDQNLLLTVAFTPIGKTSYRGLLLVKAQTYSECNILMKVPLLGYGGCCKLSLHGFSTSGDVLETNLQLLRFASGNGERKKFLVLNKGSRPAFVCITSQNGPGMEILPSKFVVLPFSQTTVMITSSGPIINQTLLVFYGEELLRQAIAKRLPNIPRPSLLHMLDASGEFQDQDKVPPESVYPTKAYVELGSLFYKAVAHFDLRLCSGSVRDNPREATMSTLLDMSAFNDDTLT